MINRLLSFILIWLMAALPLLPLLPMQQSHASVRYSNTQGITYATIGEGDITVRDYTDFDLSALNRDVNNVQRVISREYFELDIPGINLARLVEDIKGATNTLQAATATVPEEVREQGAQVEQVFANTIGLPEALRVAGVERLAGLVSDTSLRNDILTVGAAAAVILPGARGGVSGIGSQTRLPNGQSIELRISD